LPWWALLLIVLGFLILLALLVLICLVLRRKNNPFKLDLRQGPNSSPSSHPTMSARGRKPQAPDGLDDEDLWQE